MKKISILFVLICITFCVSCRHREVYNFLNSFDKISSISIVRVSFDTNDELREEELLKVENAHTFIKDFETIDCYKYFGDPRGLLNGVDNDEVIKIDYQNGEYELINWFGQSEYTISRGFSYYAGYSVFDEEQFNSLIDEYLDEVV